MSYPQYRGATAACCGQQLGGTRAPKNKGVLLIPTGTAGSAAITTAACDGAPSLTVTVTTVANGSPVLFPIKVKSVNSVSNCTVLEVF
jgi:hypothetical protein|tara:strand:- start:710 stop:973 length:264 start_codon:yes stop_codon:yes gene_type:complete